MFVKGSFPFVPALSMFAALAAAFVMACGLFDDGNDSDGQDTSPSVESLLQFVPSNVDSFTFGDLEDLRDERVDDVERQFADLIDDRQLDDWGIDMDDIDSVVVSDPNGDDALTLLRGWPSVADVEDALDDAGFSDRSYRGVGLWREGGVAVALVGDEVIVIGERDRVEEALDVFLDGAGSAHQEEEVNSVVAALDDALVYHVVDGCNYRGCRRWGSGVEVKSGESVALFAYVFRDGASASEAEREVEDDIEGLFDDPDVGVDDAVLWATGALDESSFALDLRGLFSLFTPDQVPAPDSAPTRIPPTPIPTLPPGAEVVELNIMNFQHADATVKAGTVVIWTNKDKPLHTVTHINPGGERLFDSATVAPDAGFRYHFTAPGTYEYQCLIHPVNMKGTITVTRPAPAPKAEIGNPAPNFTIKTYENDNYAKDQEISLADLRGKPVVINFWFPACTQCQELMFLIKDSYNANKDDVHYVAIQVSAGKSGWEWDRDERSGQDYVTDKELPFIVGGDFDRSIATAYGVEAYPTTYFLDKDLILVATATYLKARGIKDNIRAAME